MRGTTEHTIARSAIALEDPENQRSGFDLRPKPATFPSGATAIRT
jgi:hypothetical protein